MNGYQIQILITDIAANMGLNAYMEASEAETKRQIEATLKEVRKHSVLFKLPDRAPAQPWEMDRIADETEYVPYSQRYVPPGGGRGLHGGAIGAILQ